MVLETKVFDPKTAGESEFVALNAFGNVMWIESMPDDPPRTLDETMRGLRSIPPFVGFWMWAVWRGGEIVATANTSVLRADHNQHVADFGISVHPELRRRGIAKGLLKNVVDVAQKENRRLLISNTESNVPSGEAFMNRLGAQMALAMHFNQLNLDELDRTLMREWVQRGEEKANEFELGLWEGLYPQEEYETIVRMNEVMNTAPRDDLDVEDFKWTVEQLKQAEESLAKRRTERWTMFARHKASGQIAGYTEVYWNPDQPEMLGQGDTGVFPEYRNHGLGRWMKAAMVEKVLRDRPQVKRIRTGNAHSNAPMLRINDQMGFKPFKSHLTWQVELSKVKEYLA
jgi:GNAT superfamily N-acetyltransferase